MSARRRRGLLLMSVALASGGMAASQVHERERAVEEQVGAPVEVLVAARDIRAGARIPRDALALRQVPARFVPPDALGSAAGVVGARAGVSVVAGAYVTAGLLERSSGGQRGGGGPARGRRDVTVEVAGAAALAGVAPGTGGDGVPPGTRVDGVAPGGGLDGVAPGARVDVLVSTEPGADGGRTLMALAGAELIALAPGGGDYAGAEGDPDDGAGIAAGGPTALATLRVTLRQAVYLTAADNFAREIRLLARPARDRSSAGAAVSQGQL